MNSKKSMALFPGQGSQYVGMGKDLYDNFPIAREVFEEASDAIRVDLKKLSFNGPDSDLTLTHNTQPCLLTTSVACFRVAVQEFGFKPDVVAGHSLGEYSALVAAEAIPLSTAARWVRERGTAMQEAVPAGRGKMAAVLGPEDQVVEEACQKATWLAQEKAQAEAKTHASELIVEAVNYNAPGQIVIAGHAEAVDEFLLLVSSGNLPGTKAIPLQVSAPFHSKLMKPARERMSEVFMKTPAAEKPNSLRTAYVPNRTARISKEPGIILDLLIEQIDHPVLWKQSMSALLTQGYELAFEFGPGKVLQGLLKRIAKADERQISMAGVDTSKNLAEFEKLWKGN